ncbi:DMT family transporter [Mesorhizobium sp. WSM2239]|uniref:DMT family transporter n=2 Tax=unclassified Mesorhizobium TaxID=325217 RepID=A0AAU8D597_9HYPH
MANARYRFEQADDRHAHLHHDRSHPVGIARLERRDWLLIGLIALFGMFGFTALMLYGMQLVSGVVGATIMSTTPAVTALGAILFLKEHPT